jgi:lipopolysaccharide/colanic/teichoic acid biosynthesis glycosyltransferase
MINLAINNKTSQGIAHFDMSNIFYTNSFIFSKFILNEQTMRVLETLFAFLMLVFLLPVMLLVALAIKISMKGDVFYSQERVGKNGIPFFILKFRTMVSDAEVKSGPVLSTKNDPRVTRLGRILRSSHLDEFPQLINVIKGEMSFIGPRPERAVFVEKFEKEINQYRRRREVKPGITGLAQICLPYDASAKDKLEYDIFYIENQRSLFFNLIISYYTALKMVTFFKN